MTRIFKSLLFVCFFGLACNVALADRGAFRRKKSKLSLNIKAFGNLKNSIYYNLKSGLKYNGSSLLSHQVIGNSIFENNIVSYKKGNIVYIYPYKQRMIIPVYSTSTGYKIIIRP